MDMLNQFGVTLPKLILQLMLFIAFIALPIWATILSLRRFRGAAIPLWILLSWLLPFIGAIITIIAACTRKPDSDTKLIP
jgi:hypothetical protein